MTSYAIQPSSAFDLRFRPGRFSAASIEIAVVGAVAVLPALLLSNLGIDQNILFAIGLFASVPVAVRCELWRRRPHVTQVSVSAELGDMPYRDETNYIVNPRDLAEFVGAFPRPLTAMVFPSRPANGARCTPCVFGSQAFPDDIRVVMMVNRADMEHGLLTRAIRRLGPEDRVGVFVDATEPEFSAEVLRTVVAKSAARYVTVISPENSPI